jgi:PAS domain S-box-containing protein
VFLFDRERAGRPEHELVAAETTGDRRASALGDALGNEISARIGSLAAAKVNFGTVDDDATEQAFMASLDSVAARMPGLMGISLVYPETERVLRAPGSGLDTRVTLQDTVVRHAFLRAIAGHRLAATNVIDYGFGRRVFVFDPITSGDTAVVAVLAAELDPQIIYRSASATALVDTVAAGALTHALFGPDGVRLSTYQLVPEGWGRVYRHVPIADTSWTIEIAYPLPDLRAHRTERLATWIAGLALALAVGAILHFLRRTILMQRDEIARRQAAEEAARVAAEEARQRAQQARELTAQLEAAQRASQRLSTSLDPDDVVEQFLGSVAEILDADVASLYTFEEEGEVLVGRRRMVFRDIEGITDRLRGEDVGQVRAPVALLPHLGEAVSTGEPYVVERGSDEEGRLPPGRSGPEHPAASVTVPLLIAGHTVGVASWEVYALPRRFPPALVAFAQALAAPAAAALRTAELFASLEAERRRAAREALRFGAVLDQMADGVIVVDADGRLERFNESAKELLGAGLSDAPVEEWPVRFELESVDGRPLSLAEFPLTRALHGERVRRATFVVRPEHGTERHLSCSAGPIRTHAGQPAGAAMVLRDVTDEQQYAEMLRHTNRELRRQAEVLEQVNHQLREATKAKDQFLAVMSHELRTPINAIMGYSDLLDLGVKGALNADQRAMVARVRETSRHLLGLINEVLDLAKIGAGRMDLVRVDVDVGNIVDRAVQQILPLAAAKGLSLVVEEPAAGSPRVLAHADETRLMQIVVNLLSNAVKFTTAGGVVATYGRAHAQVQVSVRDTGPGIPPDQAERIFEEFYQVEGGLSRASGGTGLGLAIARRFARLMGGDITVDSEVGNGATFTLSLPGVADDAQRAGRLAGSTVLVLSTVRGAVRDLAERLDGVRVLGAGEPGRIAALARRERPDIVALDARAPDHGAWRALAALQSEPATAELALLLFANGDSPGRAVDLGTMIVLAKPLSVEAATQRVLQQLPARSGAGDAGDDGSTVGVRGAGSTVLIADDDPDVRRILGSALVAAGCEVRTAGSGGELLDIARRLQPDLVIVDLVMPGMDGIEAIAIMRSERALRQVQLVGLVSREPVEAEMEQLSASVEAIARGGHAQPRPTADLLRAAIDSSTAARSRDDD